MISMSTGSRVVPGISLTIARSSPTSALSRLLLPTFGRPTMAMPIDVFFLVVDGVRRAAS